MALLPHSTDYAFDGLPITVLNGWQVGSISGEATIHYDGNGYWRIVAITVDGHRPSTEAEADFARAKCLPHASWQHRKGIPLNSHDALCRMITAMLTTDQYRERRNIDDHIAGLIADMRASVVANRADRAYRLRAESLPSDAGVR
jgi:hypothetical protein